MIVLILLIIIVVCTFGNGDSNNNNNTTSKQVHTKGDEYLEDEGSSIYPKSIPIFKVRKDTYSNKPVSRGKITGIMNVLDLKNSDSKKLLSLQQFRRALQCAPTEPDLDILGVMSLLKRSRPTKSGLLSACAWVS